MNSSSTDLRILKGPLAWEIFRFGFPLALGMALQNAFNLVDAYLIAQLRPDEVKAAVGALGVCDQIAAIGTIVSYGVSTATATLVSTQKGAGNAEGVRHTAWQSLLITASLSLFFGMLGVFAGPVIRDLVGLKGAVADVAERYLRIILAGNFSIFFLLQLASIQRALGSSKTPVGLLVLGNLFNVVFAAVCLYGPEAPNSVLAWAAALAARFGIPRMGMVGAAWGTLASRVLVLGPMFWVLVRRFGLLPKTYGPDRKEILRIVRLAWPSSTQFVLRIFAMLFVNSLVARFYSSENDQTATTAMGLVFRVDTMALFVAMGWGSAAQTFVGQNLGAKSIARAERAGWITAIFDGVTNLVLWGALAMFGANVLRFFGKDEGAVHVGLLYLQRVAPSYMALGIGIVLGNAMAGAGATKITLKTDAFVVLGIQIPLCLFAVLVMHAKIESLFLCVSLTAVASAAAYAWVYLRSKWKESAEAISSAA